jgi:hypothetical protein
MDVVKVIMDYCKDVRVWGGRVEGGEERGREEEGGRREE